MGAQWGNDRPRPIRDHSGPMGRGELIAVSILMAAVAALAVFAVYSGGHRVESHLERLCNAGSAYACAASDGHR